LHDATSADEVLKVSDPIFRRRDAGGSAVQIPFNPNTCAYNAKLLGLMFKPIRSGGAERPKSKIACIYIEQNWLGCGSIRRSRISRANKTRPEPRLNRQRNRLGSRRRLHAAARQRLGSGHGFIGGYRIFGAAQGARSDQLFSSLAAVARPLRSKAKPAAIATAPTVPISMIFQAISLCDARLIARSVKKSTNALSFKNVPARGTATQT
jgi:hypothetical protein